MDIPPRTRIETEAPISNSLFIGNKSNRGGAIYNSGKIGDAALANYLNIDNAGILNSSFYNNTAISTTSATAKGGAIYSTTDLTITADNGESVFSGNKLINNGVEESNAIYMGAMVYKERRFQARMSQIPHMSGQALQVP